MATIPNINFASQDWNLLRLHVQEQIETLRTALETSELSLEKISDLRGRIAAFRYILNMEERLNRRNP